MKKIAFSLLVCFYLPAYSITVSNVTGWNVSGQEVTFDTVEGARMQLQILAPDVVRVRFAPDGVIRNNISRAVIEGSWESIPFTTVEAGSIVIIETSQIRIDVEKFPCIVTFKTVEGVPILADDASRRVQWGTTYTRSYKSTQAGECYLGLGWRTLGLRRNGSRFVMNNVPSYSSTNTFYGGIPFWYGYIDGRVYGMFFDDTSWGEINVGQASGDYMYFQNTGGQIDYYFFAGPDMPGILDGYTRLTGRPFMPPKWATGYQQCRWSYRPQSQVLSIANQFRSRNIPCDVLHLDIDYMPGGRAFTFDSADFPNPTGMISTLHSQGFRVVANISPFLFMHDPLRPTADANNYILRKADGSAQVGWHDYWYFVGGASSGSMVWIDFSKTSARNWWKARHTDFLNHGIDGIWNDLNEPDELGGAWPSNLKYDFDGQRIDHGKTSTQYCLLQTDLSYETLDEHWNRRPFVLSRGAYAGIQRSAAVWSGDNTSNWDNDLRRNIPMGLSMSISGQPHNGHDIGGFFGYPDHNDKPSGELFARWMQWGVFSAFCRGHHDGWGNYGTRPFVEPWEFGSTVENICREFIGLRYRLMPYLYSLFHEAHVTGAPIHRPTVYDFQADPATIFQDYDFMFGPFLLISPVHRQGHTSRTVYLPDGPVWYDWWMGEARNGGSEYTVSAPLERIPIHVPEGAIVPMGPVMNYTDQFTPDEIALEVWPSETVTEFILYEDDGLSFDYREGEYAKTTFRQRKSGGQFEFSVSEREGSFNVSERSFVIRVHAWNEPVLFVLNNQTGMHEFPNKAGFDTGGEGYFYDSESKTVSIRITDTGDERTIRINGPNEAHFWQIY